jgi:hypothetical protein
MIVAIPARDEAERLPACLQALAGQRGARCDGVVVLLNNTTDDSAGRVRALMPSLPFPVTLAERHYPPAAAHAGTARAEAMRIAAGLAGPDGVLLTTDADGMPAPNWLAANRDALALGAEVVCGRAEIDPVEALLIPQALHDDDALEVAYGRLLDEIHALADPDPSDPWPRHTEHSGASIAVTVEAWSRAGGVPPVRSGEDRAFLAALRRVDARIRHAPEVVVTVSGRTVGRAPGGMADTMRRRMVQQDVELDDSLEPPAACLRRAELRARLRRLFEGDVLLPRTGITAFGWQAGLPAQTVAPLLSRRWFGEAWAAVEAESPLLSRQRVLRAELDRHMTEARRVLQRLRDAASMEPVALPCSSSGEAPGSPERRD